MTPESANIQNGPEQPFKGPKTVTYQRFRAFRGNLTSSLQKEPAAHCEAQEGNDTSRGVTRGSGHLRPRKDHVQFRPVQAAEQPFSRVTLLASAGVTP